MILCRQARRYFQRYVADQFCLVFRRSARFATDFLDHRALFTISVIARQLQSNWGLVMDVLSDQRYVVYRFLLPITRRCHMRKLHNRLDFVGDNSTGRDLATRTTRDVASECSIVKVIFTQVPTVPKFRNMRNFYRLPYLMFEVQIASFYFSRLVNGVCAAICRLLRTEAHAIG